jgi:hypothetical protein
MVHASESAVVEPAATESAEPRDELFTALEQELADEARSGRDSADSDGAEMFSDG